MVLVDVYVKCGGPALMFADAAVLDACSGCLQRRSTQQHKGLMRARRTQWHSQFGCTASTTGQRDDAVVKVGANAEAAMHGAAMCRSSERCHCTMAAMQSDAKTMNAKSRQFAQVRCAMFENGCSKD